MYPIRLLSVMAVCAVCSAVANVNYDFTTAVDYAMSLLSPVDSSASTESLPTTALPQAADPVDDLRFVVFTASWCGPCQRAKPILAAMAREVAIETYDADRDAAAFRECEIGIVPEYRIVQKEHLLFRTRDAAAFVDRVKALRRKTGASP